MNFTKFAFVTLIALTFSAPLWAREPHSEHIAQLAAVKNRLAQRTVDAHGAQRGLLSLEQRKVGNLIDDLQAGKPVDAAEIDRVLRNAEHDAR